MLVLSRKPGELIRIGGDVEVMVLGVRGGKVRIGLTAPAEVNIQRQELFERIVNEQSVDTNGEQVHFPSTGTRKRRRHLSRH